MDGGREFDTSEADMNNVAHWYITKHAVALIQASCRLGMLEKEWVNIHV